MAMGPDGVLYVAEKSKHRVRTIVVGGNITTLVSGYDVNSLTVDANGVVYFTTSSAVYRYLKGDILLLAGNPTPATPSATAITTGFNGDDISANMALVDGANAIVVSAAGDVYFSDVNNSRIRRISAPRDYRTDPCIFSPSCLHLSSRRRLS